MSLTVHWIISVEKQTFFYKKISDFLNIA